MNLQLASEVCQAVYQVNSAPKTVTLSAPGILANTQIYCIQYENEVPTHVGYLNVHQTSFNFKFTNNGSILLLGMLVPSLNMANGNTFDFSIGVGDGTGRDFSGTMGADINIVFMPYPFTGSIASYTGKPKSIYYNGEFQPQRQPLPFLLNITDPVFNGQSQIGTNAGITFSIDADNSNHSMLEQMVWIHMFNGSGNLLGVVDTLNNTLTNNYCRIPYVQTGGFQFAAFIQGSATSGNQFTFAIGDPKTDAQVSITEVDE